MLLMFLPVAFGKDQPESVDIEVLVEMPQVMWCGQAAYIDALREELVAVQRQHDVAQLILMRLPNGSSALEEVIRAAKEEIAYLQAAIDTRKSNLGLFEAQYQGMYVKIHPRQCEVLLARPYVHKKYY